MSYYVILYHIISYDIVLYHIISYYIILYHITSHYITLHYIIYIYTYIYIYNIYIHIYIYTYIYISHHILPRVRCHLWTFQQRILRRTNLRAQGLAPETSGETSGLFGCVLLILGYYDILRWCWMDVNDSWFVVCSIGLFTTFHGFWWLLGVTTVLKLLRNTWR